MNLAEKAMKKLKRSNNIKPVGDKAWEVAAEEAYEAMKNGSKEDFAKAFQAAITIAKAEG